MIFGWVNFARSGISTCPKLQKKRSTSLLSLKAILREYSQSSDDEKASDLSVSHLNSNRLADFLAR